MLSISIMSQVTLHVMLNLYHLESIRRHFPDSLSISHASEIIPQFLNMLLGFCVLAMNSFTPAEDDRVLLSYQDGSMLNVEGKAEF